MADHPHTIDRWDDATGENLISRLPPSVIIWWRCRPIGRQCNDGLTPKSHCATEPGSLRRAGGIWGIKRMPGESLRIGWFTRRTRI